MAITGFTGSLDEQHGAVELLRRETLLKTGALQNAIINSANFSSIATDEKGVIQIFNVGAERMLGYAATDVLNKITPADISDPQEVIARAAELSLELSTPITPGFEALVFKASRGIEDIYELTYIRKDGSRFPAIVSVTALRDAQGGVIGYLLIGTDNTVRKEAEAAKEVLDQRLRDQQFYTRSLIEANIDALMMTDPKGIISDVNQQMMTLTGRTRDELIGAPSENFFTHPARAAAAIQRVLIENKVSNYELTVRVRNGDETVVSYNAATFYDQNGNLRGVFASARDVTERKLFESALNDKNIELERASRLKTEFLATMSHELRTPLNAIIGFSEALRDGLMGPMSDHQRGYVSDIFTSGQHLLSLINDILDLSKVEAGMMTLELETVDLPGLLSDSLSIVREKAAAQNISLKLVTGEGLGACQFDRRKTKQVVYNLLANAVKFSHVGGAVTLNARRVPRSAVGTLESDWPIHPFALAQSDYTEFLEISVQDSGIGISRSDMTKLFQAFSQIDSSLARKFEGTGLGLAMVKQLAELHEGTVAVASEEGQGACFAVWFPARWPVEIPAQVNDTLLSGPQASAMVYGASGNPLALVIEDEDHAAELVRLLLEAEGFTVLRARDAESALVMAPQHALSLITLDLQLPGMSGLEFLLQLRENRLLAQIPVVIISGLAPSHMALSGGAAAVLQKPISRAELKTSLANLGLHAATGNTYTVLVADDDPKAVEVIAAFLPAPAYAVVRAYGGREAIALAQRLHPDLILLDLMMPEVSGFDVVEALHRDVHTAGIPILVVTARNITPQDQAALMRHSPEGGIRIIKKAGFDRAQFIKEVRQALMPTERRVDAHRPGH